MTCSVSSLVDVLCIIITRDSRPVKPMSAAPYGIYPDAVTILSQKCLTRGVSSAKMGIGQLQARSSSSEEGSKCLPVFLWWMMNRRSSMCW